MSRVAVSQYSVRLEAELRARQKKMEEVRQMLSRCIRRRKALEKLGEKGGNDLSETLDRYEAAVRQGDWLAAAPDCDRLHSELPVLERELEGKIIAAKERRLRLELTAASLSTNTADRAEQELLAKISHRVKKARTDELGELAKQLESIMTKRLSIAAKESDRSLTAGQLALACELMNRSLPVGERIGVPSTRTGAAKRHGELADARDRIEHLIIQLASTEENVSDLLDRARVLMTSSETGQRNLQLDSLMFEAAERLEEGRKEREFDRLSGGALAELAPFDGEECERLRSEILSAREGRDGRLLERLNRNVSVFVRTEAAKRDAVVARAAILRGLKELGYEIRMNGDVWEEGTRIEAQRPEEPNYDVELSAATNGKIQSKVRAYEHAGRSTGVNQRDVEMEQSWCDHLRRLHDSFASQGIVATIEDEKMPGSAVQQPLPARSARGRKPALRTQRNEDAGA